MIKAIIFDVDNTLIDFIQMKEMGIQASATAMIDAGLDKSRKSIVKRLWELLDNYGYEDKKVFQRYIKEMLGKVDYRILAHAINAYRNTRIGFMKPFPHVMQTLSELHRRGIRFAVVTDAPRLKAYLRLTAMRIEHLFDVIVTFEDTKKHKPHREPFKVALRKMKLAPEECIMIGDNPSRDIMGAKKLGFTTVFAKYGNPQFTGKSGADYDIKDFSELLKMIEKKK